MLHANIFDISNFAIYDGPGIRTIIFFKDCNLRCRWCQNPEGQDRKFGLYYNKNKCINCKNCINGCPVKKINNSILNRFSNEINCLNNCIICYDICPSNAIYKVGKYYSVDELISISLEDLEFYNLSGGGVTLSGGEPLLQIDFVEEFLKKIKEYNVNIIIDTAGFVKWDNFCRVTGYTDIFYFDLKLLDKCKHISYTGHSNDLILSNLLKLSKAKSKIVIRIPLIPKITDTDENLEDIIDFIKINGLKKYNIELLPYNELANLKYKKIGINCKGIDKYFNRKIKTQSKDFLFEKKEIFIRNGLKVRILSLE